jgi:HlyD family secretion protein
MKRWMIIIVILLAAGGGVALWRGLGSSKSQAAPFRMGLVSRGKVSTVVTATGTLSAVTTVDVGSQVSGTIQNLYVDFNSPVHKGDVVARLDPTFLQASLNQAEANLQRAQATLSQAQRDLSRTKDLFEKQLASQADYDNAVTAEDLAKAGLKQMQAQIAMAKVNLAYSVIKSPIDGIVVSRNVDVGQTVAASLSAPTLFTIAQDLSQMQVETGIDEADIGGLKEEMDASFTVDAYPDEKFKGSIKQIRYAAKTDQGVVTYPVILTVSNPDLKLRPGMTANVSIVTAERESVMRLPATALRFKPTDTMIADNGKNGTAEKNATGALAAGSPRKTSDSTLVGTAGRRGGRDSLAVKGGGNGKKAMSTVYVKVPGGKAMAKRIMVGLNDGSYAEILNGELAEGDSVIVGLVGTSSTSTSSSMPGMGGGPPRH